MPFNPCGYAVDWGRRPYTTKARFWDHPDAPLVDQVWYFTDLPFLPFPTVFNSKDWCEDPWHYHGLGEVFGAPRKYNGKLVVPGLTGKHFCGTPEQFLAGGTWPPAAPPQVFDPDGIPACCKREKVAFVATGARPGVVTAQLHQVVANVGVAARPDASVSRIIEVVANVGVAARPDAIVSQIMLAIANVATAARPDVLVEQISVPTVLQFTVMPDGKTLQVVFDQSVNIIQTNITIGGTIMSTAQYTSGTGTSVLIFTVMVTMFTVFLITVTMPGGTVQSTVGNLPNAPVVNQPTVNNSEQEAPAPGANCEAAGVAPIGQPIPFTLAPGAGGWYVCGPLPAGDYHVTRSNTPLTDFFVSAYHGDDCTGRISDGQLFDPCLTVTVTAGQFIWVEVSNQHTEPQGTIISVGGGACP